MAEGNETDTNEASERSRQMDGELLVIQRILRQLAEIDDEAQCRAVAYLASRYKEKKV